MKIKVSDDRLSHNLEFPRKFYISFNFETSLLIKVLIHCTLLLYWNKCPLIYLLLLRGQYSSGTVMCSPRNILFHQYQNSIILLS